MLNRANNDTDHETAIDPEPFSIMLGAIAFLGSVASISGYLENKRKESRVQKEIERKLLLEIRDLLMRLEVDSMQLESSLSRLEHIITIGISNQDIDLSRVEMRFGSLRPLFTLVGFQAYDEILEEINELIGRSFQTTSRLLKCLYNVDLKFRSDALERIMNIQAQLNEFLVSPTNYKTGIRRLFGLIVHMRELLRDMRLAVDTHY